MAATEFTLLVEPMFSLKEVPELFLSERVKKIRGNIEDYFKEGAGFLDKAMIHMGTIPGDEFMISGIRSEPFEKFFERFKEGTVFAPPAYLLGLLVGYNDGLFRRMTDFISIETFGVSVPFFSEGDVQKQLCIKRLSGKVVLDISSYVGDGRVNYLGGVSPKVVRGMFFPPRPKERGPDYSHLEGRMIG